ncbi:hypothetical protein ACVWWQ_002285 [Rhodanobacter sp. TND4EL1]
MKFSPKIIVATAALGLCIAAGTVVAQETGSMAPAAASSSMGHMDKGMMHKMHHDRNGSMHKMPASVTSVDAKTGMVGVDAGGMALTVHFPPKSMAALKVGDKITLHMGFTRP